MIDFTFEFPEHLKTGDIRMVSIDIHAKTFEEAKMLINAKILLSNPRTMFDWFKLEENNYTGVKIYC
jgi:hypothetical protein